MACLVFYHALLIALFATLPQIAPALVQVNYINKSLSSIPTGIATNVQLLNISINSISTVQTIDFAQGLTSLIVLFLNANLLTVFPPLDPLNSTLLGLYITHNKIAYIDPSRLQKLNHLSTLDLQYNSLTTFPDVNIPSLIQLFLNNNHLTQVPILPLLGANMWWIDLSSNQLSIINPQAFNLMPKLNTIKLMNNLITSFPNYCTGSLAVTAFYLPGNSITCDCRTRWTTNTTKAIMSGTCSAPPNLAGSSFSLVPSPQMSCANIATQTYLQLTANKALDNFYCTHPGLVSRTVVTSVTDCARVCLSTQDCSFFNYGVDSTNQQNLCDVTGPPDQVQTFAQNPATIAWTFYVIQ